MIWQQSNLRTFPGGDGPRIGMSLVELLVVVAIMGMLAVAVLPNLSNTVESRRSREAARVLSSFIAKAHGRALSRSEWSGFTIAPVNATAFAAVDLFPADVPAVYRGDTVPAMLSITGSSASRVTRLATGTLNQLSFAVQAGVQPGDLIRFDGRGPFYEIDTGTEAGQVAVTGTSIRFTLLGSGSGLAPADAEGYSVRNTPWPPSGGAGSSFEVHRQPVPAGIPLQLADGVVIDLFWSGMGPPAVNNEPSAYARFLTPGSVPTVLFDGTGSMRQVIVRSSLGVVRQSITGPLFLLVGRADRAGQAAAALNADDDTVGANWQYADSHWIAIDPMSGAVKVAESAFVGEDTNRNAMLDVGEDMNGNGILDVDVLASQRWIRESLLRGGR